MFEYNNSDAVLLKEYGRNIHMLAKHLLTIEEIDHRTQMAFTLVDLMKQLNKNAKDQFDVYNKLWDDLHLMTDFQLEVNAPYDKPKEDLLTRKPQKVDYSTQKVTFKHYGQNIELLIQEACNTEDKDIQKSNIIHLGKLMKNLYASWNKENVQDDLIYAHIRQLSKNQLEIDIEEVKENGLFNTRRVHKPSNNNKKRNHSNQKTYKKKRKKY